MSSYPDPWNPQPGDACGPDRHGVIFLQGQTEQYVDIAHVKTPEDLLRAVSTASKSHWFEAWMTSKIIDLGMAYIARKQNRRPQVKLPPKAV